MRHLCPGLTISLLLLVSCLLDHTLMLTRSDDVVSLAPWVLTTDNERPHSLATACDHLMHLLLTLRLSPHHLDAPGDTGSDNYLASTRCLLPHSGPLSDLTSLQPRSLLH